MKKLLLFTTLVLLCCCQTSNSEQTEAVVDIKYNELELKSFNDIPDSFIEQRRYLLLSNDENSPIIGRVGKVRIENDKLYVLDIAQNSIFIYDNNGQYLSKISKVGRANNEYLGITDFDISGNQICIVDGVADRVILYQENGDFIKGEKLKFEADIVKFFKEGFLFGLCQWNSGEAKGSKIVSTDYDLLLNKLTYSMMSL